MTSVAHGRRSLQATSIMLASSVFGARPHLVLVVAHDRRGPYSALRGLARFVVPRERAPGDRERALPSFPRAACRVSKWETESVCGFVWRFYGLPLRLHRSRLPNRRRLSLLGRGSAHPAAHGPRPSPRTDVRQECGVKEPQPVDSRRHDADRPDPLDPRHDGPTRIQNGDGRATRM